MTAAILINSSLLILSSALFLLSALTDCDKSIAKLLKIGESDIVFLIFLGIFMFSCPVELFLFVSILCELPKVAMMSIAIVYAVMGSIFTLIVVRTADYVDPDHNITLAKVSIILVVCYVAVILAIIL